MYDSFGNLVLLGAVVHKLQHLPLASHYVGGLTRASISVRQHGARAALERHLTSRLEISACSLVGKLTDTSHLQPILTNHWSEYVIAGGQGGIHCLRVGFVVLAAATIQECDAVWFGGI